MTTYVRINRVGYNQTTWRWHQLTIGVLSECGKARMSKAERFAFGAMEANGEIRRDGFAHGAAILEIQK